MSINLEITPSRLMRISKDQASENRRHVIGTAAALFREQGFDSVSVADLMKAAGFTHGGFYNHFGSKEALSAEALRQAFAEMEADRARARNLAELISNYLSDPHRRARAKGCPAAALANDTSRGPPALKGEFADGLETMIRSFAELLPGPIRGPMRRRAAVNLVCLMVGALSLARAVPDKDRLAAEILAAARDGSREIASPES